jgi:hypothetical protein
VTVAAGLAAASCARARPVTAAAAAYAGPARADSVQPRPRESARVSSFRWSILASSLLGHRSQPLLAMADGKLLELSGLANVTSRSPGSVSPAAAAFDPATGRWHRIASIPGIAASSPGSWNPVIAPAGRELLVANGPVGSCAAGCWPGAALYDPAANRWSRLTPPRQLDGLAIQAASWTGQKIIVAAVDSAHEKLGVAAYDPATRHWQVITPALPRRHPPRIAAMAAADGRVILWSLWDRVTATRDGFSEYAGVDVLAMRHLGTWRNVTGRWPQDQLVTSPVPAGTAILVSPGQIWCGWYCIPPYTWNPGYFANPATLARTIIPSGPLGEVNPAFIWAGNAIIAVNLGSSVSGPGIQIQPDDMALWDPASRHWTRLPAPPGRPAMSVTPLWTGTELLALTDNGQLLSLHR